VKLSNASI